VSTIARFPARGRVTWSPGPSPCRTVGTGLERTRWTPLAASAGVFALGLLLVFGSKIGPMATDARELAQGRRVNLAAVHDPGDLDRALTPLFPAAPERRFVAQAIVDRLPTRGQRRLDDVDAIAAIRVPVDEIAARDLGDLSARARALVAGRDSTARATQAARGAAPARMSLLTTAQFHDLRETLIVRTPGAFRGALFLDALLFLIAFAGMHLLAHARGVRGDRFLLPAALLLSGLGFTMLVSVRDPLRDAMQFASFAQGALLGGALFVLATLPRWERTDLRRLAFVPLLGALAVSLALIAFGRGPQGSDAKVNLLGAQPVELIRLLLVLFLAGYFARRWVLFRELDERPLGTSWVLERLRLPRLHHVLPVTVGVAASILFSIGQRDLGPALLLVTLFLALYAVSRGGAVLATAGLAAVGAAFLVSSWVGFPATVATRTGMWLSPWENGLPRGIQLAQSLWAFASGGFSGMGLGLGSPEYVPAVHTDLILSAIGEELGFLGVLACLGLYALIAFRGFRIARDAADDYAMFLGLGLTLNIVLEALLITAGATGLVPLTGVVMPFVSYGRSALVLHLLGLGMLWSLSANRPERQSVLPRSALRVAFDRPRRVLLVALVVPLAAVALKAADVQIVRADRTFVRESLELQADRELRYQANPRLRKVAAGIPRGDILDRDGIVLATSDWSHLERQRARLEALGVDLAAACDRRDDRHYPFGGITYHLLGDLVSQRDWGSPNSAFVERRYEDDLCGYDDHARVVTIRDPRSGENRRIVSRDLSELIPLWRHRYEPGNRQVKALLARPRDLTLTVDVRLQAAASQLLKRQLAAAGVESGAVVVLDPADGALLASVSAPWPSEALRGERRPGAADVDGGEVAPERLDRARYGAYPPGSTFKIVTAAAALAQNPDLAQTPFTCRTLPDGVGAIVRGRLVHDDSSDRAHGVLTMEEATAVSCNAYYAQLGARIGWPALSAMAQRFGVDPGRAPDEASYTAYAIESAYGQAQVLATPLEMARVAAVVANGGRVPSVHWTTSAAERDSAPRELVSPRVAGMLGRYMHAAVDHGTARRLSGVRPGIAGKTGTAQVANGRAHAWFIGFAPYGDAERRVAFSVLLEHGGYGGDRATALGGEVVQAAAKRGLAR
jgi:cell division protein FtsW (lipid II flippase)/cell division protein FtsI/penicillin-binding protein 2